MAKLTKKSRSSIPSKKFANPKSRKFPLEDDAHIRSARSYERYATPAEKKKIDAAAKKAGIGQKKAAKRKA